MPDTSKVITSQRYSQGFTYQDYLAQVASNRENYQQNDAAFKLSSEDAKFFKDFVQRHGGVKALAILEDWCPDAHRGLPIIANIAQASGMELRVFYRDKNPDIINLYLNQGKFQSIPVFAFFNKDLKPLCHWIERPAVATLFTEQVLAELTKKQLSEEEMRQERRKRNAAMSDGWRQETVRELKELLAKTTTKIS
ncbi:MAG: hypothetical protein HW399_461 [Dehalococcoidia bacterium]|nr:hypothetical protein [Dehalococcoidia bacterium]